MKHDFFLSYRRSDSQIAEALVANLQSKGALIWWDQDIRGGADWRDSIVENLTDARNLVILFSDDCNSSKQLKKELAIADHLDKNVIPVLIEETEPKGHFLYELANRNWIQIHPDPMTKLDKLAEKLLPAGGVSPVSAGPPPLKSEQKSVPAQTKPKKKRSGRRRNFLPFRWFDLFPIGLLAVFLFVNNQPVSSGEIKDFVLGLNFELFRLVALPLAIHWTVLAITVFAIVVFPIRYFFRGVAVKKTALMYLLSIGLLVIAGAPVFVDTPSYIPSQSPRAYVGERAEQAEASMKRGRILSYITISGTAALLALGIYAPLAGQRALRRFRKNLKKIE